MPHILQPRALNVNLLDLRIQKIMACSYILMIFFEKVLRIEDDCWTSVNSPNCHLQSYLTMW